MKRSKSVLLVLLAAVMVMALTACSQKPGKDKRIIGDLYKPGVTEQQMADSVETGKNRGIAKGGNTKKLLDIEVKYFDNLSTMLAELTAGRISVATLPQCVADYIIANNDSYFTEPVGSIMKISTAFQIGVSDPNKELLADINAALASLKADGTLDSLAKTYIYDRVTTVSTIPKIDGADTIKVVLTGDLPPLDYITEAGDPAGYNVALLSELSRLMNINIELVTSDAASRAAMLSSGRADVIFWMRTSNVENPDGDIINSISENPDGVILSDVYFESDQRYLVKK